MEPQSAARGDEEPGSGSRVRRAIAAHGSRERTGLVSLNAISDERLRAFGLDRTNPAGPALLTSRIDSPLAVARGFKAALRRISRRADGGAEHSAVSAVQQRADSDVGAARQQLV